MSEGTPKSEVDVLLVGLGSTSGLRIADDELAGSLERAGLRIARARADPPREVPTLMGTDLLWARAARRAALRTLQRVRPRAVIYSSSTAALLWPRPGAIRFDAPAAANRPGRHGLWQRPLERRRLRQAPLLLPWSAGALAEAGTAAPAGTERVLVLPAPIDLPLAPIALDGPGSVARDPAARDPAARDRAARDPAVRDIAAITYAANPHKKGFDRVLAAWRQVRPPGERLVVVGVAPAALAAAGFALDGEEVEVLGAIAHSELHTLLRRARVFLCAPRREDYGIVQLEALAAGCQLVSTPAPGPYVALPLAHALDPRLVSEDLAGALRAALEAPRVDYASRAAELVEPFGRAAVDRLVAKELPARLSL